MIHIKSETGGELPPNMMSHIGKFTEYIVLLEKYSL
jgi:hypothetical protein